MIWLDPTAVGVSVVSALAMALAVRAMAPPTPRLAPRVRPYTVASRTTLGRGADVLTFHSATFPAAGGPLGQLMKPVLERAATRLGRIVDRGGDEALLLRLRQAGLLTDLPESERLEAHRVRQLTGGITWAAALGLSAPAVGAAAPMVLLLAALGFLIGVARWRGRIDSAIAQRRARMRIELYTVNHLLAMHARVGGGVVQAMQHVVRRGSGAVVEELAEVLQLHRGGRRIVEALEHAARVTPEPSAARTYRLLANGVEYGADLAEGLRTLSIDIRGERAEALKRAATRRRAAMLVPIIGILAPVMLLFIAAPLPSIVLGAG